MEIHLPIDIKHKLLRKHPKYLKSSPKIISKSPVLKPSKSQYQKSESEIPRFSSLSPVFRKTLDENIELRKHSPFADYSQPKISTQNKPQGMNLDVLSISPVLLHTRYKSQPHSISRRKLMRIKSQGYTQTPLNRGSQDYTSRLSCSHMDSCTSVRCVNTPLILLDSSHKSPSIYKLKDDLQKILSMNLNTKGEIPSLELTQTKNTLNYLKKELKEISGIATDRTSRSQAEVFHPRFKKIGKAYSQREFKYYQKFMKLHARAE